MVLEHGNATLQICERLRNNGGESMEFMWAHHPAFGWPFLEEGCRIEIPAMSSRGPGMGNTVGAPLNRAGE
jgi:uncharacterized protein DUF4432